ncbi:MAG: hypothetical protein ACE3L7_32925 [Candidatus Pristimantibacillus sp.]
MMLISAAEDLKVEKFIGEEDKKLETTDLNAPTKCDKVSVK